MSAAGAKRGNERDRIGRYPHPPTFPTTLYICLLYIYIYLYICIYLYIYMYLYPSATAGSGWE